MFAEPQAFFRMYGPVFDSNARFSLTKPVPSLGTNDDPESKVKAFYTFWRCFSSWRDFSCDDEHKPADIETAESRDERRWMQRQNEVAREKRKRAEYQRIQSMVERAYVNDPRLARFVCPVFCGLTYVCSCVKFRFKMEVEKAKEDAKRQKEDVR